VVIHVTIGMVDFVSTKNRELKSKWSTLCLRIFFTKKVCTRIFYQEEIHYCTALKYSTETVINAFRLINKFDHCYN